MLVLSNHYGNRTGRAIKLVPPFAPLIARVILGYPSPLPIPG